ncbi:MULTISPECIES: hypothetical protein [unclassified Lentimonas]|uniref:hypothetical protein n=1 Tax=unclassified Lentimonas TaxID=2630993 RepID=UPI001389E185|nr:MULTISPECIES: hypothetical protein [unclassified Lentimonas]
MNIQTEAEFIRKNLDDDIVVSASMRVLVPSQMAARTDSFLRVFFKFIVDSRNMVDSTLFVLRWFSSSLVWHGLLGESLFCAIEHAHLPFDQLMVTKQQETHAPQF